MINSIVKFIQRCSDEDLEKMFEEVTKEMLRRMEAVYEKVTDEDLEEIQRLIKEGFFSKD